MPDRVPELTWGSARRQLAFDIWWLGFALWLICIIEVGQLQKIRSCQADKGLAREVDQSRECRVVRHLQHHFRAG